MKISFIGAGNVAWHLSQALENAGHGVEEIFSKDIKNAESLIAHLYNAQIQTTLNFSNSTARVFFLCVTDDSMPEVVQQLVLPEDSILIHTSGSKSLADLDKVINLHSDIPIKTGVFYPLQTFTKGFKVDFLEIPICIEAEDEEVEKILIGLGQDISDITYAVNSEERRVLHVAAVFACNFTNHLWAIAQELVKENDLEFDLLKPLISETFRKAMTSEDIFKVQSGPASRGDQKIITQHLLFLKQQPEYQHVYRILSISLIVALYRSRHSLDINVWQSLRETNLSDRDRVEQMAAAMAEPDLSSTYGELPKLTPAGLDPLQFPVKPETSSRQLFTRDLRPDWDQSLEAVEREPIEPT